MQQLTNKGIISMETRESLLVGAVGILGSIVLPTAAKIAQLEAGLRIGSLLIGILVGLLSCISLIRGLIKK